MIKAVLIDLDGTLVDTTDALYQVYLNFLKRYGHKGSKKEFKSLIGPSIDEIVGILKKKYQLEMAQSELASMYVTMVMLQGFKGTKLFPGVGEFVDFAKKNKLKMALVTSGTRALVKACLEPLKIENDFDLIVTSEDVEKSKPDPEIYRFALKHLKIPAKEAIAIEDSEAGKKAAEGAGLKVWLFKHNHKNQKKEVFKGWDQILDHLRESTKGK